MKHKSTLLLMLGVMAPTCFMAYFGQEHSSARATGQRLEHSNAEAFSSTGKQHRALLVEGSIEAPEHQIDPTVFRPLGPKAYQISRLDDARPPGDAIAYVQNLIPRSEAGDSLATFNIYLALTDCQNYLTKDPYRMAAVEVPGDAMLANLEKIERKISECAPLSLEHEITQKKWLEIAARQGSIEAKVYYSINPNSIIGDGTERLANPIKVDEWKERSLLYLREAAGTGNLDAIARLSSAHENGIIAEHSPVLAYAYALTANRIKPDSVGRAWIQNMEDTLSNRERETAASLARSIYQSCCTL